MAAGSRWSSIDCGRHYAERERLRPSRVRVSRTVLQVSEQERCGTTGFEGLRVAFGNCSLKRSSDDSHTQWLMDHFIAVMEKNGVHKNEHGQFVHYGKVGGCLVTDNEGGVKAVSMEILYALQHIGYCISPQADAGWIGEAGPAFGNVMCRGVARLTRCSDHPPSGAAVQQAR